MGDAKPSESGSRQAERLNASRGKRKSIMPDHRPDRVRNHVRICFLAHWLSAKLRTQWRLKGETIEVHNLLRQLQTIRLGRLEVDGQSLKIKVTRVPKELNAILSKLGLLELFTQPPAWAACPSNRRVATA